MKFIKTLTPLFIALLSNLISLSLFATNKEDFFKHPTRSFSVIVGPEGYLPNTIIGFAGEKMTLYFTSLIGQESCFVLPSKDIYLGIKKSNLSKIKIRFKNPGTYNFYCPAQDYTGQFLIYSKDNHYPHYDFQSRKKLKKQKLIRMGIEGKETLLETWRPKDY